MYGSYSDPWAQVVVMLLAFVGAIVVLSIIAYVLGSLGLMKMFQKSGVEGWKAWVPFLSAYELFKLVWDVKFFGIMVGVGVLASVLGQGDNIILSIFSFLFGVAGLMA